MGFSNGPLLLLGVLLAGTAIASRVLHDQDSSYDFFLLVRQWPGTFCAEHSCPLLKHRSSTRFTIHGLWPNREDGTWPQFCDSSMPFDAEEVDDIREDLDEQWPSFMDGSTNENFWAHEWNKHGTCALGKLPSEHKFFQAVLDLHYKYDLHQALESADIVPSPHTRYDKEDLEDAIRTAFGVDALLHCSQDGQLTEVWMCFDKQLQPIDCQVSQQEEHRCQHISLHPLPGTDTPASASAAGGVHPPQLVGAELAQHQAEALAQTQHVQGASQVTVGEDDQPVKEHHDHDHDHDHDGDHDDHDHHDKHKGEDLGKYDGSHDDHYPAPQHDGKAEGDAGAQHKRQDAEDDDDHHDDNQQQARHDGSHDDNEGDDDQKDEAQSDGSSATSAAQPSGNGSASASQPSSSGSSGNGGRRAGGDDSPARTACIAGAGAVLVAVCMITILGSWARRADAHLPSGFSSNSSTGGYAGDGTAAGRCNGTMFMPAAAEARGGEVVDTAVETGLWPSPQRNEIEELGCCEDSTEAALRRPLLQA